MNSVERVKNICKERKIPISRIERELGFANGYIGQLKKGTFPDDRLAAIAEYLNVTIDYLMTGEEKEPSKIKPNTLAAHFEGEEFSEDEMNEIMNFVEFVKGKRK